MYDDLVLPSVSGDGWMTWHLKMAGGGGIEWW